MTNLANNINRLMKEQLIDRETLSKKAGLSKYTLRNILLSKTRNTGFENVNALAKALGVTADYLLTGDTSDKEIQISYEDTWDGVLYSQAMALVEDICSKKFSNFDIEETATRQKMMRYAEKIYMYAKKQGKQRVDNVFADVIIDEAA